MPGTTIDTGFLARQGQQILSEPYSMREEVSDIRTSHLWMIDCNRRVERRVSEMRDHLEFAIKAELSRHCAHRRPNAP